MPTGPDAGDIALRDHVSSLLLGRRGSGTLELRDGAAGLRIRAQLPATELGSETYHLVDRGDLRGMSFAFAVAADGDSWHEERNKPPLRLIHSIDRLYEVSVVAFPAYDSTTVTTDPRARTPTARDPTPRVGRWEGRPWTRGALRGATASSTCDAANSAHPGAAPVRPPKVFEALIDLDCD